MASRFLTPLALVEALQNRDEAARRQFHDWLASPITRLVEDLHTRHHLPHRLERLTSHALHAAETYLRMRPARDFARMSESAFRAAVLFHVARQIVQPFGKPDEISCAPDPLPEIDAYHTQTVYLPYETVGSFRFGGDWYGGRRDDEGRLWIMVADVTGHGYAAYLLANALPAVWRKCWAEEPGAPTPGELLAVLHELLADCLPEDVFVECTLLRLEPDGRATAAAAGGARMLLRCPGQGRLELVKLRGVWLGFELPPASEEQGYVLEVGDELLLGTDGIFDQLIDHGGPGCDVVDVIRRGLERGGLLESTRAALEQALSVAPQKDDITIVAVRRRGRPDSNGER